MNEIDGDHNESSVSYLSLIMAWTLPHWFHLLHNLLRITKLQINEAIIKTWWFCV